jgi:hypothetical protein
VIAEIRNSLRLIPIILQSSSSWSATATSQRKVTATVFFFGFMAKLLSIECSYHNIKLENCQEKSTYPPFTVVSKCALLYRSGSAGE